MTSTPRSTWYAIGDHGVYHSDHIDPSHLHACRPVAVIDPEDHEQVERLAAAYRDVSGEAELTDEPWSIPGLRMQAALREFAAPTPPKPEEPTDPKARVTDRRDNIWRLLADGDWVCTDGPDIGEYLVWWQLAERGPLTVEGVTS